MPRIVMWLTLVPAIAEVGASPPGGTPPSGATSPDSPPTELTLTELVENAPQWNLSVGRAELHLAEARGELATRSGFDATQLTLSGDYLGSDPTRSTLGASMGIEPVPQVRLGAGVSSTLYGKTADGAAREDVTEQNLSATLSPLAVPRLTWQEERAVAIALVQLAEARKSARRSAEEQGLAILLQRMQISIAEEVAALRTDEYELVLRRREVGDASFNEVQEGQRRMIEASRAVFQAQQQALRYRANLTRTVPLYGTTSDKGAAYRTPTDGDRSSGGTTRDASTGGKELAAAVELTTATFAIAPLTIEELRRYIAQRVSMIHELQTSESTPLTQGLAVAEIELRALDAQRGTVLRWRPDLSIRGGVTFSSDTDDPTPSAGIELTISPSQFKEREQSELDQQIALQRLEIASERRIAKLELDLATTAAALEQEALAVAETQLDRDREALREGHLLVDRGGITQLELRQLEINVIEAEIAVFEASTDLYLSLGQLLELVE